MAFEHSSDKERSVRSLEEKESGACLRPSAGLALILRPAPPECNGRSPSLLHLSLSMTSSSVLIESPIAIDPASQAKVRGRDTKVQREEGEREREKGEKVGKRIRKFT